MKQKICRIILSGLVIAVFGAASVYGADDIKKRQKILEKIEEIRREKAKLKAKEKKKLSKIEAKNKSNRKKAISLLLKTVANYKKGHPRRCDALFQLGDLYYKQEQEDYEIKQKRFSKQYSIWEKSGGIGAPPVEPTPQYTQTTKYLKELIVGCPSYERRDLALYKAGNVFTMVGAFDDAFQSFDALVKEYPKSENLPFAHLRIGEYYYLNRDNASALKHYKAVGMKSGASNYLLALYRIASCYYNMSQFDKAIEKFFEYVELAQSGSFSQASVGFEDEAKEYMAISFSETEKGAERAMKFFKDKGGRDYQDYVIYTIGIKNRDHDNVPEAIRSLKFLLQHYPNYIDAPNALKALVDCYVLEKEYQRANELRERLISEYGPGSKWERSHSGEAERIEKAQANIKEAGSIIPIYYHKLGVQKRDSGKVELARSYMNKAIEWYGKYIKKFPSEKWNVYTFHYYMADLLSDSLVARYKEAAAEFDWVSREDTTTYPSRKEAEKKRKQEQLKEERDIRKQHKSDIQERVQAVQVNPQEAGFAAIVMKEHILEAALKKAAIPDTAIHRGINLPEMQEYLRYIRDYKNRFPDSPHSAEVAFLEANIYFGTKQYKDAIMGYKFVVTNFPNHKKVFKPSLENLAKAHLKDGNYQEAIMVYKRLYHEFTASAKEKTELVESIAAAMFQIAETKQKNGDYSGAADFFKRIVIDYPDFSRCDVSLYNAGYAYEQGKMYREAAREFERVFDKFTKSKLRKDALLRSAAVYTKGQEFLRAARIYLKYSEELKSDSQAVPCIFRAAFMYDSAGDNLQSARTYEKVYEAHTRNMKRKGGNIFINSEKEAPGALYSAGLIYEKARKYTDAIRVYKTLEKSFPTSRFTPEAAFSIAICYEKMGDDKKIAESYLRYTQKYASDKAKTVESLMKVARAYSRLNRRADQERIFRSIISLQQKHGKNEAYGINPEHAAEAYFILGERSFQKYIKLDLRTRKRRDIPKLLKKKQEAMVEPLKYFTDCIALQTDKWTTRATYMCGEIMWNLLEVVKNQPILERDAYAKAIAQVKVNELLPDFYNKAMEYYFINIDKFGNKMGIENEWIEKSQEKYGQGWYQMCFSHVENGDIFNAAPNPFPKGTQEHDEYQLKIKGVVDKLVEKCVPCFAQGIQVCTDAYVNNSWVERMKKELERHDPQNAMVSVRPKQKSRIKRADGSPRVNREKQKADHSLKQSLNRIAKIMADEDMPVANKVSMLKSIELGANRKMAQLNEEIKVLKGK